VLLHVARPHLQSSMLRVGLVLAHFLAAGAVCPPEGFDTQGALEGGFNVNWYANGTWFIQQQMPIIYRTSVHRGTQRSPAECVAVGMLGVLGRGVADLAVVRVPVPKNYTYCVSATYSLLPKQSLLGYDISVTPQCTPHALPRAGTCQACALIGA
jgi:hypothetical protein